MSSTIDTKLEELQRNFEEGKARLQQLEQEQQQLISTLLRIEGAFQALTEFKTAQSENGSRGLQLVPSLKPKKERARAKTETDPVPVA